MKGPGRAAGWFVVDGTAVEFLEADTVASSLLRAGITELRRSLSGEPRGVYCGIGVCNDCLVTIGSARNVKACQVEATEGLVVTTSRDQ